MTPELAESEAQPERDPVRYAQNKMLLGLIGSGIGRSLAAMLLEAEAPHHGLRLHYQMIDTAPKINSAVELAADLLVLPKLIEAAQRMGFSGVNITYPFKQAVLPLLDQVDDSARAMNAVNCITMHSGRLLGYNTDAQGWAWGFERVLPQADMSRVVLLGCGGAGSAVAHAALGLGAQALVLVDGDAQKSADLAASLALRGSPCRIEIQNDIGLAMQRASGLIHATPVGMHKLPGIALDAALLRPHMWVSDLVYVPLETALLQAARAIGCATLDGGHMNVGQAILNFGHFTGRVPDAARMDAYFRRLVQ